MKKFTAYIITIVIIAIGIALYLMAQELNTSATENPAGSSELSTDETADWKDYSNAKFGVAFKFPSNWIIDENGTDIHLFNMEPMEQGCKSGFSGMEIVIDSPKDSSINFSSFVESMTSPDATGLTSGGNIEELLTSGNKIYKVEHSGWDTVCQGPGYFIEQSPTTYTYIFTGSAEDSQDTDTISKIINSIKYTR